MDLEEKAPKRSFMDRFLPVRYVYLRSHDEVRAYALTARRQILLGLAASAFLVWSLVASGAFLFDIVTRRHADSEVIRARAASERLNADLQARLESAVVRMSANHGALDQTAAMIERRHAALAQIMTGLNGVDGAVQALAPKPLRADMPPIQRILAVRLDQERLLDRAETFAQTRAERLRLAFRLAGLNPAAYVAAAEPLGGYRDPKPMVFSGLYPIDGSDYPELRDALDKLKLNDAALQYEPETSVALGFGFRIGFLGLLHLEIVRERLEREFDLDLISTAPNVIYRVVMEDGSEHVVTNPSEFPTGKIREVHEPVVRATVLTPSEFTGTVMELCQGKRGQMMGMDYLSEDRVELRYSMPLAEIVFDFFDQLKSRTRGYASLDYEPTGTQVADLVKVDILLHGDAVDAFSSIVHKDKAYNYGVNMAAKLKELIPRQQFEVPIQAAIGARIIARESIRAIRKDVLAKCYGGDISRKRKLLEKQKEGKKRMKMVGRVEVPQEAFIAALTTGDAEAAKNVAKKLKDA